MFVCAREKRNLFRMFSLNLAKKKTHETSSVVMFESFSSNFHIFDRLCSFVVKGMNLISSRMAQFETF